MIHQSDDDDDDNNIHAHPSSFPKLMEIFHGNLQTLQFGIESVLNCILLTIYGNAIINTFNSHTNL